MTSRERKCVNLRRNCNQNMHINFVDFWSQPQVSSFKNCLGKRNYSEINILPCHMTGSALIDPKFKIFLENTNMCQSLKF